MRKQAMVSMAFTVPDEIADVVRSEASRQRLLPGMVVDDWFDWVEHNRPDLVADATEVEPQRRIVEITSVQPSQEGDRSEP